MSDAGHYASRKLQRAYDHVQRACEDALSARLNMHFIAGALSDEGALRTLERIRKSNAIAELITLREALEGFADRIGVKLEKHEED